jgi:hypothetical protein
MYVQSMYMKCITNLILDLAHTTQCMVDGPDKTRTACRQIQGDEFKSGLL